VLIISLRTDKPEAELAIFQDGQEVTSLSWQAHRQLAETIHRQMQFALKKTGKDWGDVQGIVCYQGPGSFTGLRIGLTVANALAYSNQVPIVASGGEDWQQEGIKRLLKGDSDKVAMPEYGAEAHITLPRK
jgi:tRNA threonylcarbamoyladenosine biosynthesis protein TsaB